MNSESKGKNFEKHFFFISFAGSQRIKLIKYVRMSMNSYFQDHGRFEPVESLTFVAFCCVPASYGQTDERLTADYILTIPASR